MSHGETAADRVYARLRARIISGDLESGTQHSIYRLAEELGVSRTPVREAVLLLADAGLLTIEKNRGVTIRGMTLRDIREVFEFRLIIEVPAVSYAALHGGDELVARLRAEVEAMRAAAADDDEALFMAHDRVFHETIVDVMGNIRLTRVLSTLRDTTKLRWASTVGPLRSLADIEHEHAPIIDAIERRDPVAAAAGMEEHIVRTATLHQERILGDTSMLGWQRRFHEHVRVGASG